MAFIQVTDHYYGDKVYINTEKIVAVCVDRDIDPPSVVIVVEGGSPHYVAESLDKVMGMLP